MRFLTNHDDRGTGRGTLLADVPRGPVCECAGASSRLLDWLPPTQRELLTLLSRGGLSHRRIAPLLGVSPGTVSRQLARLRVRLGHPVVRALDLAAERLDHRSRRLAIDRFLNGMPINDLLVAHRLTRHQLNHELATLCGWARATLAHLRRATSDDELDRVEVDDPSDEFDASRAR